MPFGLARRGARRERTRMPSRRGGAAPRAGSEWKVFRALQLANFTQELYLDDDEEHTRGAPRLAGSTPTAIVDALDAPEVSEAYERDKAEARSAAGSAAHAQDKTSTSDGPVRFTAPSVVFRQDGRTLWRAVGSRYSRTTCCSRTSTPISSGSRARVRPDRSSSSSRAA